MRKLKTRFFLITLMILGTASFTCCTTTVTPVYLLRHAEKRYGTDPNLTPAGQARAEELRRILENVPVADELAGLLVPRSGLPITVGRAAGLIRQKKVLGLLDILGLVLLVSDVGENVSEKHPPLAVLIREIALAAGLQHLHDFGIAGTVLEFAQPLRAVVVLQPAVHVGALRLPLLREVVPEEYQPFVQV